MNRNGIVQCIPAVFFSAEREEKREDRLHFMLFNVPLSMCTQKWVVNQKQVIKLTGLLVSFNKADVCRSSPVKIRSKSCMN